MKKVKFLASTLLGILALTSNAQMVGPDCYMSGNYVQIGIRGDFGYEGINIGTSPVPGGYVYRGGSGLYGFYANPQMTGWSGTAYDGDFFTPGSPENGWGFEILDATGTSVTDASNNCAWMTEMSGSLASYTVDPATNCKTATGNYPYNLSGYDINFEITYKVKPNDLYYTTVVTVTNNGSATIPELIYYRNVDPDNNQSIGAGFTSVNTIAYNPDATCQKAHVYATQSIPWTSYLGFAGIGPNFRVSKGGFSNRDASNIWYATGGLIGTTGSTSTADEAISIAYRIQNLAPGDSEQFKFVVILDNASATAAIDNLFYFDYTGSLGGPAPECVVDVDTALTCAGNPVTISINSPVTGDYSWSWSPTTGLSTTTGTTTDAAPTVPTLYTITGTSLNPLCYPDFTEDIFVDVMPGPDANYVDPGPQCATFDLTTLVFSDLNAVPGTGFGFYTTVPATLADTLTGIFTGTTMSPGDVVYLVYWDPVLGCINSELINITWGGYTVDLAITDPTCANNDGVIVATPSVAGTYTYTISPAVGTGGGASNTFSNLPAGTYTITVDDGAGCIGTADTVLAAAPAPVITSVVTTNPSCVLACDGSGTVTVTGAVGALTYEVTTGGSTSAPSASNIVALCDGAYTVVATDAATGCTASFTGTVTAPPFTITPSAGSTICIGQSATVSAVTAGGGAPINIIWDNGLPNGTSNSVSPTTTTTYTAYAQDASGCQTAPVTVTITVNPPLNIVMSNDTTVCPGGIVTINAVPSGGNGVYTINWTNNVNATTLTGTPHSFTPAANSMIYTAVLTDGCGTPSVSGTVTVGVFAVPTVTFTSDNVGGCNPVTINFTNTSTPAGLIGTSDWTYGDGGTSTGTNPTYVFNQVGCHDVTLTITTVDGCVVTGTTTDMICVYDYPVADFTASPQTMEIFDTEVQFTNTTIGGNSYFWDFAGLGTSTSTDPEFTFPDDSAGTYLVCLSTVSNQGCFDSVCHVIEVVQPFLIFVPNAFTPTGDGLNDVFIPLIQGDQPDTYEFMIFNRWGEVIFSTNDKAKGWDGTHNNIKSKEDVYVWKVVVKDARNSKKYEYKGHVTLLR